MNRLQKNKFLYSLTVTISSLILSLFVNRGFLIIESVVGEEYKNIMLSDKFESFGRLGHRLLTPMLSRLFEDIFIFNLLVLAIWLFYITYHLYDKYEQITLTLLIFSITTSQIILFTLNFGFYPDPLTVLLSTISLFNIEKNNLFVFLGILNLINNEIGFFIILFLVLVSRDFLKKIPYFLITIFLYLIYRQFINLFIKNESSGITTYLNELKNFELDFFMLFGVFAGMKFLFVLFLTSEKSLIIFTYLLFYILVPLNMAVDYTRYGSLLVIILIWILKSESFKFKDHIKSFAILVLVLNIITPKYYIWGDQITYLRDSKLHFFDITGKNFQERGISN